MNLISEKVLDQYKFGLYFMGHAEKGTKMGDVFEPVLELTHNHGTENDEDFKYHNGNSTDNGAIQGFGHTGFLVDDLEGACEWLEAQGVQFKKKPSEGSMKDIAFALDPDGYWVEIIRRGFKKAE